MSFKKHIIQITLQRYKKKNGTSYSCVKKSSIFCKIVLLRIQYAISNAF